MRRFILPPGVTLPAAGTVIIQGELFHHMVRVLRLTAGTPLLLADRQGTVASAELVEVDGDTARARLTSTPRRPPPPLPVTLCQALPKGEKMDLIIQKGVEIGVGRFILFPSRRSVGRIPPERRGARLDRLTRIGTEAARQSGGIPPEILIADDLDGMLEMAGGDLKLVAWEEEGVRFRDTGGDTPPRSVVLLVGPEGGLTPEEVSAARGGGFIPLSLGPRILRTETAGLVLATLVQYRWGDLG